MDQPRYVERAPVTAVDPRELDGGIVPDQGSQLGSLAGSPALIEALTGGPPTLDRVREGMTVVDRDDATIGTVSFVKMGDPDAISVSAADRPLEGSAFELMANVALAPTTEELPTGVSGDLLRVGYLRIHTRGLLKKDRFAPADAIARIDDDVIYLSLAKEDLAEG